MELKTKLNKPCTDKERTDFIVKQNHKNGYEIKESDNALEAWGFTKEEIKKQQREKLDCLTLTPADVERALYKSTGLDFEDLKQLISEKIPSIDTKALAIEFRAKDFYRGATTQIVEKTESGATVTTIKLFDKIGELLGFSPEDIDYLFQHKYLPVKKEINDN